MSAYSTPSSPCPYCGESCEADWVDVGVGMVQCGPYVCDGCGASEIGPEGRDGATEEERKTGWYRNRVSPYANTVGGVVVDHRTAKAMYEMGLLDEKPNFAPSDYVSTRKGENNAG